MATPPKIPWPRILAEGVAIVVSILLAFGIEAWWSSRETRLNVQTNLAALRDELSSNRAEIEFELLYRHAVIASIEKLSSAKEKTDILGPDEIDRLIGDVTWFGTGNFSTGALESILQSGVFSEIEDRQLQRLIASLPDSYDDAAEFEFRDKEFTSSRFFTYLNSNGSFNQIANLAGSGRPGVNDIPYETRFRVDAPYDHSHLLESTEFLGLLAMAHGNHLDVVEYYQRLTSVIEESIGIIDLQLSERSSQ